MPHTIRPMRALSSSRQEDWCTVSRACNGDALYLFSLALVNWGPIRRTGMRCAYGKLSPFSLVFFPRLRHLRAPVRILHGSRSKN